MAQPHNPAHAVRFELEKGRVSIGGTDARVLVPANALARLTASAGEAASRDFGRHLGTEIGRRVAERVAPGATVPELVEHLGGELALAGLGSLAVEVWGRALIFKVEGSPLGPEGDALLCAVLEGALQRGLTRDARVIPIARGDTTARLLVVHPRIADKVTSWLRSGVSWGDALARLNTSGTSGAHPG